ncbi:MAG: tetratricopeptide repeat protein [Gemmatimonadaceae bacterium]
MKATQRRGLQVAGLLAALAGAGVASPAGAQGARTVEPDARILVATFRSTDRGLGVAGADAIRARVSQEVPQKQLLVIRKEDINGTLAASGYAADSALSPSDMKELAKLMRADEILDGMVTRTPDGGVRVEARLMLARDVSLAQPLPAASARNVGDAARQIARDLKEARKQLAANKRCENHLRDRQYDQAAAAAREGIAAYPQATLARLCLLSAQREQKATPDAIITSANEILAIDPNSRIALGILYEAQKAKGENEAAVATLTRMQKADPTNAELGRRIAGELALLDPAKALPVLQPLVEQNPGDVELMKLLWAIQLRAQQYKAAIQTGEALAKLDTSVVDSTYFTRMIAAYAADSQPQRAAEWAGRAVQRYPQSASAHAVFAQTLRRAGQLQQAAEHYRQAVQLDPKVEGGYLALIVTQCELNQTDAAFASGQAAIAAGQDKGTIGQALIGCAAPAVRAAQEQKTRAGWQRAYEISNRVDQVASSPNSKFFVGVSAFQVGIEALQTLNRTKSCAETEVIENMWAAAQIAMPAGASVDRNTAGQIMGVIQQYSPNVAQAKKAYCKGNSRR